MGDPGVSISMVYPIMKTIVHKGYTAEAFIRYTAFDGRLLHNPEARIPGAELERLVHAAVAFTNDEHFGMHQGQLTEIADLGVLGYVMMHAGSIADALRAYQRYNVILCSGYMLEWEARGEQFRLYMRAQDPAHRVSRHCLEDMASSLYGLMCKLSNRRIPLRGVQFEHAAEADVSAYVPVFGRMPRFGGDGNWLEMDKDVLDYPILYSDARLAGVFESLASEIRDKLIRGSAFADQVSEWMMRRMPAAFPTLQETAAAFGMSARSLQAKLQEERTSYNELSANVRKELAIRYLGQQQYSVGDIAYLLHYSEPSVFQSAFKKWTGLTPGQYRHQASPGGALPQAK